MRLPVAQVSRARLMDDPRPLTGEFSAWGVTRQLDLDRPWEAPDLGRSWTYSIQYFDRIPALAAMFNKLSIDDEPPRPHPIVRLLERWIAAHPPGRGVAWEPYPIALRIINWVDVLEILGNQVPDPARARIAASLWTQAAWLHGRLEYHLLGTHLLKDLKALLLATAMFGDARALRWGREAEALWRRELPAQVHDDGSHVEASIMYHGMALWDVLDVLNWNLGSDALRAETRLIAQRMVDYLASVQTPMGEYPLFGDAAQNAIPSPRFLLEYAARLGLTVREPELGLRVHADAGFAVWRAPRQYFIAKIGGIGVKKVAAHAHCDTLSYEWHVDGVPMIVDSGVRSYEAGADRFNSRSTRAHNTLQIDGREQHEIWGVFRVARRAQVSAKSSGEEVEVRLIPWHDSRLEIVRQFFFYEKLIRIEDRVQGPGNHQVESRVHFHPECQIDGSRDEFQLTRGSRQAEVEFSAPNGVLHPSTSFYCEWFGEPKPNFEVRLEGKLPFECGLRLRVPDAEPQGDTKFFKMALSMRQV